MFNNQQKGHICIFYDFILLDFTPLRLVRLTPEYGIDELSRNIGKKLSTKAG